jgi:hypothetical protein
MKIHVSYFLSDYLATVAVLVQNKHYRAMTPCFTTHAFEDMCK